MTHLAIPAPANTNLVRPVIDPARERQCYHYERICRAAASRHLSEMQATQDTHRRARLVLLYEAEACFADAWAHEANGETAQAAWSFRRGHMLRAQARAVRV